MFGSLEPTLGFELLFRTGHLSYEPRREPPESAILASRMLDDEAKLLLLSMYARLAGLPRLALE